MNVAALVLITLILSSAASTPTLGVKPGTKSTYTLHSFRADAFPIESLKTTLIDTMYNVEVLDVKGSNITFSFHSLNATYFLQPDGESLTADITNTYASGSPNGYVHLFFFPSNLVQGSAIIRATYFDGWNMTVTDVRMMPVLGVEREVCHVSVNKVLNNTINLTSNDQSFVNQIIQREDLIFDRATGLLVSWSFEFASAMYASNGDVQWSRYASQSWGLESTNAWSAPPWLRLDVLGSLGVVLFVIVIVLSGSLILMMRRMHAR